MWENRQRCDPDGGPYWRVGPNNEYIRWYCTSTRTKVKPAWSNVPIEDAPSDSSDDIADVYDTVTRYGTQPERAPLHDYMYRNIDHSWNENYAYKDSSLQGSQTRRAWSWSVLSDPVMVCFVSSQR
ncbi:hypothetical protein SETIT_3G308400v2 [Setaria italica]|uniref:Uncharacterized protein n=1 Tax=Setaria italica TaxID=4555 RepID=A0A368QKN5_SETIT|nr:hypothetical protein SETIT_3G308400v2 [Setaria italica]